MYYQYLVEKQLVTASQILEGIDYVLGNRDPIGRIAVDLHLLSIGQVFRIIEYQCEHERLFGDIAIELDLLTTSDVEKILKEQEQRAAQRQVFSEAVDRYLVESDALSLSSLDLAQRSVGDKNLTIQHPA